MGTKKKGSPRFGASFFILCVMTAIWTPTAMGRDRSASRYTDRLIVTLKSGGRINRTSLKPSRTQLERFSRRLGVDLHHSHRTSQGTHVLNLPQTLSVTEVQSITDELRRDPEIAAVEPDQRLQTFQVPSDPLYTNQWHYYDAVAGAALPAAWDITTGDASIVVAVVDTGILPHADLVGRYLTGYNFISDLNVSGTGGPRGPGAIDPGDWTTADECGAGVAGTNSSWHGTHTAGTIGASANNGIGGTGINWVSKILPVRALGHCGGYTSDIIDSMRWAAGLSVSGAPTNANPAKVLSLSLGGVGACSAAMQSAVTEITNAGSVIVVAAGNSTSDVSNFTPASCNGVITVSALHRNGGIASYSNFGTGVAISAPGGNVSLNPNGVLSTLNTGLTVAAADAYAYYEGTSMATPHVSGVVSLMLSANPTLTPSAVLSHLQASARSFPTGLSNTCTTSICGAGILDAGAAVGRVSRLVKSSAANLTFASQNFGSTSATQTVTMRNTNTGTLSIVLGTLSIGGADGASFLLTADTCSGQTLAANASCTVGVQFSPAHFGTNSASLNAPNNGTNNNLAIPLTGIGAGTTVSVAASASKLVGGSPNTSTLTFTRTGGDLTTGITIQYTLSGSAQAGVHFSGLTGSLDFVGTATTATATVTPLASDGSQSDKTLVVDINSGTTYGEASSPAATITITQPGSGRAIASDTASPAAAAADSSKCLLKKIFGGTSKSKDLAYLQQFRGDYLMKSQLGRKFVHYYYAWGGRIAGSIANRPTVISGLRLFFTPIVDFTKAWMTARTHQLAGEPAPSMNRV